MRQHTPKKACIRLVQSHLQGPLTKIGFSV
jgi:hypothetical protein